MKKIILAALLLITVSSLWAQKADWKEMHTFHKYMGGTFHPAEENNLRPLKEQSGSLLQSAKNWQQSKVPQGYDAKAVQPVLKKLVTKCNEINKAVKSGKDDATLTRLITEGHEIFHEIMEKCRH